MPRILFQRNKCIGCNACVEAAPNRWRVSMRDGRCNLVGGIEKKGIFQTDIHMVELDENLQAAANCPMRIIQVDEGR
ncbi:MULTISPECIES: ferredoxin [Fulvivirga]|uniref:Ferredoxin n=1 Tax=Fulvivirga sediminis TaxID=2803949 RepID=A0A937F3T2_9BACT|nr:MULTISPECIES: ferredoxin [Fulvivirga]MBL3655190.1 ferredoxin [Fulvivirga sediminis]UII25052.1 ferredoxin [Fulvivirga maritima]